MLTLSKPYFQEPSHRGARFDIAAVFGHAPVAHVDLPIYPWQNKSYKLEPSHEAIEAFLLTIPPHPLLGQQMREGEYVWDAHIDTQAMPFLVDHKVDGKVIIPGAAFAEMALEAARQWLGGERIELRDMDIIQPLVLGDDHPSEVRTRLSVESGTVEITSRKRLSGDEWQSHAKCRVCAIPGDDTPQNTAPELRATDQPNNIHRLYKLARQHGIEFGPLFQRMIRCDETEDNVIEVVLDERDKVLDPNDGECKGYVLHPLDLDACFHGLNILYDKLDLGHDKLAFIPVRLGTLRVYQPGIAVRTCRINILRSNRRGGQCDFELFDHKNQLVATLTDARFRAAALVQRHSLERTSYSTTHQLVPLPGQSDKISTTTLDEVLDMIDTLPQASTEALEEQRLLLDAAARRAAYDVLVSLTDDHGGIDIAALSKPLEGDLALELDDQQYAIDRRIAIVSNLLAITEQSGMAEPDGDNWKLSHVCELPPAGGLMANLLAEEPRWIADCVLLNHATQLLPELITGRENVTIKSGQAQELYSPAMLEQLATSSPLATAHIEKLASIAEQMITDWPQQRPLRVLELGNRWRRIDEKTTADDRQEARRSRHSR